MRSHRRPWNGQPVSVISTPIQRIRSVGLLVWRTGLMNAESHAVCQVTCMPGPFALLRPANRPSFLEQTLVHVGHVGGDQGGHDPTSFGSISRSTPWRPQTANAHATLVFAVAPAKSSAHGQTIRRQVIRTVSAYTACPHSGQRVVASPRRS